ncbi:MAG: CbtB domain-containing protein [bacterium]
MSIETVRAGLTLDKEARLVAGAAVIAILGLYVLVIDQGFLLSLFQGTRALDMNLIHELVHDARHAAGFPCH